MFYDIFKLFLRPIFCLFYRLEVIGKENVPKDGALIVASNHASNLDPVLLGVAVPRHVHFMAKEELFQIPIIGWFCNKLGAFPVKRGSSDRNAIKKAFDIVQSDRVLAIFPEGTRSKDGNIKALAPGAMMIAAKSKTTIVPAAISGSFKASLKNPFPKIKIEFGKPIECHKEMDNKESMLVLAKELKDDITSLLSKNQ